MRNYFIYVLTPVLFFNNKIGENCRFNKVITDVNSVFGAGVSIGSADEPTTDRVSVVGVIKAK